MTPENPFCRILAEYLVRLHEEGPGTQNTKCAVFGWRQNWDPPRVPAHFDDAWVEILPITDVLAECDRRGIETPEDFGCGVEYGRYWTVHLPETGDAWEFELLESVIRKDGDA